MNKTQITKIGIVLFAFLFSQCSDEKADGFKTIYFPNSKQIKQSVEYKNGKKNGSFKEYYRNGNLKAVQRYVNDTLNDTSFFYHENGNRSSIQIYRMQTKTKRWQKYNKQGKLYWEAGFKNNQYEGEWLRYSYRNIKLLERFNYKEGNKDGKQECFYDTGKPKSVFYYDNGTALAGAEEWQENGKKVNNDFKITVSERDEVLLKNKLTFIIRLEHSRSDDVLFETLPYDLDKEKKIMIPIKKTGDHFTIEFDVPKGGFVMKEVQLLAKRKTALGNTISKTTSFMAAANNY